MSPLSGAEDGIRTRDPNLGKVVRYRCATSAWTTEPSSPLTWVETTIAAGKLPAISVVER